MSSTQDDVNTPMIAAVGFLGTLGVFATVILLVVVFYRVEAQQRFVKDTSRPQVEVSQLAARQRGNLVDYRLVDKEKEVYGIPIRQAMAMTVARRRENPQGPPGTPDEPPVGPKLEGGAP